MNPTSNQPIDIYECPKHQDGKLPLAYMIAVMTAAQGGAPVQTINEGEQWETLTTKPLWAWNECAYRIDPASRPAPTHPDFNYPIGGLVVCLGPNAKMHSGNETLFTTGRVYRVVKGGDGRPAVLPDDGSYGGFGLFNWCLASQAEQDVFYLAPGHNPAKLTVQQVGEGYRLLTASEIGARLDAMGTVGTNVLTSHPIQYWTGHVWDNSCHATSVAYVYRTKLSPTELAALIAPRPKVKVPLTPDDIPAVCWVRHVGEETTCRLVTAIETRGVWISESSRAHGDMITYDDLMRGREYSSDRRTWRPAHKEVRQS